MPSPYFSLYTTAPEFALIEDLYNEAIYQMGFGGYYIPNSNSTSRDLIYGDDPLKKFDQAYLLDMYLVNTMDFGDENDFFSKFGLEVRNQVKIQLTAKEFKKRVGMYDRPREGDLVFIPFMKDSGELFEIKFVNTSKDLYVLGRPRPYYYEISLEPFKYNDESIDTGVAAIDNIEVLESNKIVLNVRSGSGNFLIGETVYQGNNSSHIASAEVAAWDSANTILTVMSVNGEFSNTAVQTIHGNSSNVTYTLISVNEWMRDTHFDNLPLLDEVLRITDSANPFGSLTYYNN